jgi:hypothetical protein
MRQAGALRRWRSRPRSRRQPPRPGACVGAGGAAEVAQPVQRPVRAGDGRAPCPTPLGPAYTEAERRVEAHSRLERGTTCWLAGLCAEPNAYRYDAANATAATAVLRRDTTLADTAIWVTAQRRFIYLEGCVGDAAQTARAEALIKGVADVERVIPALALPGDKTPYTVAAPASRPR